MDEITLDDVIPILENKVSTNPAIVRLINEDISIRNGKFGTYIFYKTHNMTKPKFIKFNKFKGNYNTCAKEEIEKYVNVNK